MSSPIKTRARRSLIEKSDVVCCLVVANKNKSSGTRRPAGDTSCSRSKGERPLRLLECLMLNFGTKYQSTLVKNTKILSRPQRKNHHGDMSDKKKRTWCRYISTASGCASSLAGDVSSAHRPPADSVKN